jgi:hypothetical protein
MVLCIFDFLVYFFPSTCSFGYYSHFFSLIEIYVSYFGIIGHLLLYKLVLQVGSYKAAASAMGTFRLVQWPTTKQGESDAENKND